MVVGQRQPQLLFKPGQFFGKAIGASRQTAVALSLGEVIPFDETGIDRVTHR